MHVGEKRGRLALAELTKERRSFRGFAAAGAGAIARLDPETAARRHLDQALESESLPQFTKPSAGGVKSDFNRLGTETIPLTGTTTVKFRQTFNDIPVYGSLVTVELDENNDCVAINSSLAEPKSVDAIASIPPTRALATVAKKAGYTRDRPQATPRLHYYFDKPHKKWTLAYIVENVLLKKHGNKSDAFRSPLMDYVVDAHDGTILAELPRTPTLAAFVDRAPDELERSRRFTCDQNGRKKILRNASLNVETFDFAFKDVDRQGRLLPGVMIKNPPSPWSPAAVSAHANAEVVAGFLRDVLKRNNIDNKGGTMTSSINCLASSERAGPNEWLNAAWDTTQMLYGQRHSTDGKIYSMAAMLDIVGHEMFHGVTDKSARLEYVTESGALNESYSDIFGVIIANFATRDIRQWDWRVGVGFDRKGVPLRSLKSPTRYQQPKHMRDFVKTRPPYDDDNDWGEVHGNSGIHNYAAYKVMSASSGRGMLFEPRDVAAMFYLALTQHLTRTSGFSDSRRAVVLTGRTLFRNDGPATRDKKITAIEKGFTAAGIKA